MPPLSLAIAFAPLALYFFALAAANIGRRSRVVTGLRDLLALALGLVGFVLIGPILLFLPVDALGFWDIITWPMLTVLYALLVVFVGSMFPPRLVVYNISIEELRNVLSTLAPELDQESRWCGNSLAMPGLGIQFYLEPVSFLRNVSLIATGRGQDMRNWNRLEKSLIAAMSRQQISPNRVWMVLMAVGLVFGLSAVVLLYANYQAVMVTLHEFLVV